MHPGESIVMPPFLGLYGRCQGESNVGANLLNHIDTSDLLNNIFGMNKQQYIENDIDTNAGYIEDFMVGDYNEFNDEPGSNNAMNEGEYIEDARYKWLVGNQSKNYFQGRNFQNCPSCCIHFFEIHALVVC